MAVYKYMAVYQISHNVVICYTNTKTILGGKYVTS